MSSENNKKFAERFADLTLKNLTKDAKPKAIKSCKLNFIDLDMRKACIDKVKKKDC